MKVFKFMHKDITEARIRKDIKEIKDNKVYSSDTKTYELWMNFTEEQAYKEFTEFMSDYLADGFEGFNQRSVEQILQDFEINCIEVQEKG
jgi:hypothetical protein